MICLKTIKDEVTNTIIINKSTFIARISPQNTIVGAKKFIEQVKAEYPDATHHPAAYLIGNQAEYGHANDDGEPSKTAGAPIFDVLRKNDLTNVVAVVVRYFGGIKLGAGGLVRAYAKSTAEALKLASVVPIIEYSRLLLTFDYPLMPIVEPHLNETKILTRSFTKNINYEIELPTSQIVFFKSILKESTQGKIIINDVIKESE